MCLSDGLRCARLPGAAAARRGVVAEQGDGEEASAEDQRGRQEQRGVQACVEGAVGGVNDFLDELPWRGPAPLAFRMDGTVPVSTALTTIDWK